MEIKTDNKIFHNMINKIKIKDDFFLSYLDIKTDEQIAFNYRKEHNLIDFGFIIQGQINNRITNKDFFKDKIQNSKGYGGVMFAPGSKGYINIPKQQRLQILHIHISPELLNSMLNENTDYTSSNFKKILEGKQNDFLARGKMDAQVKLCVNQLINCNASGLPTKIYKEAKALELISLQLKWLYLNQRKVKGIFFTKKERKQIHEAKEIIENSLEKSMTVPEISSLVGIGINKLNFGFKENFGYTVAGFIKEFKMQNAMRLLQTGELSVSEVAWDIGYTNVSHFSSAFKKRFHILPGRYLLERKNKV